MSWDDLMDRESNKPYFLELKEFLEKERKEYTVFPPEDKVFTAFELTPLEDIKCVIIGQDPYHEEGQAMGLAFSVPETVKVPRSLSNIYKEIDSEYDCGIPKTGDLTSWAKQGVLLLNTSLTVRKGKPGSHSGKGWETLTDAVIREIEDKHHDPVVYMLWGNHAKEKEFLIDRKNPRLILTSTHPSPFSVRKGFFGCGHFKKCNDYLKEHGLEEVIWHG